LSFLQPKRQKISNFVISGELSDKPRGAKKKEF